MNVPTFVRWYRSLFLQSNRLFYLAFFRVFISVVILWKIVALWPSIQFLYGTSGLFETPNDLSLGFIPKIFILQHLTQFYLAFAAMTTLMLFGIGRRWTVGLVIVALKIHDELVWILLDGGDNLMQFSLLYLFFADSFSYLSLFKTPPSQKKYAISHLFTNVAVGAIIGHLCLAYMISGLSKAHAEVWYNGTAMYYILMGERFQGTKVWNSFVANSEVLNVVVCYTTIVLESVFPFAVFVKRLRVPVLLMGMSMHLSIFVLMMIQTFQFIFIFHYGFFFTDAEWIAFVDRVRRRLGMSPGTSDQLGFTEQVAS